MVLVWRRLGAVGREQVWSECLGSGCSPPAPWVQRDVDGRRSGISVSWATQLPDIPWVALSC